MNFLEELQKLRESQPHPAIFTEKSINSEYCPYAVENKNCYLCYGLGHNEDCYYGYWVGRSRDCSDCSYTYESELCYECVDCTHCYDSDYLQDCFDCTDCAYCYDCLGCLDCFGCVGLRHKQLYVFNEKCPDRAVYQRKIQEWKSKSKEEIELAFEMLKRRIPRLYLRGVHNENVLGDYIYNSRNCFACYDMDDAEDCGYLYNTFKSKNCYDCSFCGWQNELNYEVMSGVTVYNCNFCNVSWYSQNLEYCEFVFNSNDCFGCVSLNHAQYRILNKQYSQEEYFKKKAEIIAQMKKEGLYGKHLPSIYPEFLALEQ